MLLGSMTSGTIQSSDDGGSINIYSTIFFFMEKKTRDGARKSQKLNGAAPFTTPLLNGH
jgi:hypothetical protein